MLALGNTAISACIVTLPLWTLFTCGAMLVEGAGPVEIVTALAEDVQKAKQSKSRWAFPTKPALTPVSTLEQRPPQADSMPWVHIVPCACCQLVPRYGLISDTLSFRSQGWQRMQDVHTLHSSGGGVPCGSCGHQEVSKGSHRAALPSWRVYSQHLICGLL